MHALIGGLCAMIFASIVGAGTLGGSIRWVRRLLLGQRAYDNEVGT